MVIKREGESLYSVGWVEGYGKPVGGYSSKVRDESG